MYMLEYHGVMMLHAFLCSACDQTLSRNCVDFEYTNRKSTNAAGDVTVVHALTDMADLKRSCCSCTYASHEALFLQSFGVRIKTAAACSPAKLLS